jgi:tRNA dimethylallyltransferase
MELSQSKYNIIVILGPTATGKTSLAAHLAIQIGGEIICADSRQVYRNMNIGTGKDYEDYLVDGNQVPFHLMDIADVGYKYNLFEYQQDFINTYESLQKREKFTVLCGGTGLYIEAVLKNYELLEVPPNEEFRKKMEEKTTDELISILSSIKKLHNKTDIDSRKRIIRALEIESFYIENPGYERKILDLKPLIIGVQIDVVVRRQRITQRLFQRLENGMVEEVEQLLKSGISADDLIYYGLEYKYITLYLTGRLTYNEMCRQLEIAIHQFAKRQMTYFRGMERRGLPIHWLDGMLPVDQKVEKILDWLGDENS